MEGILDMAPGSVSVMCLMNDRDRRVRLRTSDVFGPFLEAVRHERTVVRQP